jgi:hypothetical protein
MPASLIRSRAMVTHAIDRHRWNEIADLSRVLSDRSTRADGLRGEVDRRSQGRDRMRCIGLSEKVPIL